MVNVVQVYVTNAELELSKVRIEPGFLLCPVKFAPPVADEALKLQLNVMAA